MLYKFLPRFCAATLTWQAVFNRNGLHFAVKNECTKLDCWPLCLLTPSGGKCMCPDYSTFLPNNSKVCDTRKSLFQQFRNIINLHVRNDCCWSDANRYFSSYVYLFAMKGIAAGQMPILLKLVHLKESSSDFVVSNTRLLTLLTQLHSLLDIKN